MRGLLLGTVIAFAVIASACATNQSPLKGGPEVVIETVTPEVPKALPTPKLSGYLFPIAGGCLPKGDQLIPGAPRTYRNGFHEGLDLYGSDNCVDIGRNTPVLAARTGRVVRADTTYKELTVSELAQLTANPNTPEALDRFRGRQVWIDHGDGVITRYAHLDSIATGIAIGSTVTAGQVIAYVGESGTPESITNPGTENHLHFEVRIDSAFLGQAMTPSVARRAYENLFLD